MKLAVYLCAITALMVPLVGAPSPVSGRVVDPCAGHQTRDGIHADEMGPCDEMPGGR